MVYIIPLGRHPPPACFHFTWVGWLLLAASGPRFYDSSRFSRLAFPLVKMVAAIVEYLKGLLLEMLGERFALYMFVGHTLYDIYYTPPSWRERPRPSLIT